MIAVAIVVFCFAAAPEAASAQVAPGTEAFDYAVTSAPAKPDGGLALWIDMHARDREVRCGSFATLADATLDLRLENTGGADLHVLLDGAVHRFMGLALVLDVELTHDDGRAVARPGCSLGNNFSPDDAADDLLWPAPTERLGHAGHAFRRVPLAQLTNVGGLVLDPGIYRMRVTYTGAADRSIAASTWRGAAKSQELRFRITGAPEPLAWSEPQDGLCAGVVVDPPQRRLFFGESVRPRFLVENVTEAPIQFLRAIGSSQEDDVAVVHAESGNLVRSMTMSTGWEATARWTLPPGGRVWIDAAPMQLSASKFIVGNAGGDAVGPGRYELRYSLSLRDGRVLPAGVAAAEVARDPARRWNGQLVAPPFTVEYLDRAAK
ncbi:MAG: hypothetical protein EXS13_05915 [Planctomycetes bacterium]|nr:hypothetical protein [Planctomycetota bacterium]